MNTLEIKIRPALVEMNVGEEIFSRLRNFAQCGHRLLSWAPYSTGSIQQG